MASAAERQRRHRRRRILGRRQLLIEVDEIALVEALLRQKLISDHDALDWGRVSTAIEKIQPPARLPAAPTPFHPLD